MAVLKLIPATKDYLWGGTRLKENFHKQSNQNIIAETWELSCHPNGASMIAGSNLTLAQFLSQNPNSSGTACAHFDTFPVLIKLIDAAKDLSVQVHPDDAYAKQHEHQLGKTEMWYIVACNPGACLYYGFEKEITKEEFEQAIKENTLCEKLHRVQVKKNDVFFIEAGTIHAIGAGCFIAEVQQNSDVTYRVYDYNRVDAQGKQRELHIAKACDVTKTKPAGTIRDFGAHLAKCDYFTVDKLSVSAGTLEKTADDTSFHSLLFLEGAAIIRCKGQTLFAQKGDSFFVEAGNGTYVIEGTAEILLTYLEKPLS